MLVGFLFGIPKILQGRQPTDEQGRSSQHRPNTNLEEISDWLTKIIVGLGLVQLKTIPGRVQETSEYIAGKIATSPLQIGAATTLTGSILVYFPVVGFLGGYLVTRMYLSNAIREADERLNEPSDAMKEIVKNVQESISKIEATLPVAQQDRIEKGLVAPRSVKGTDNDDPQKGKWGGLEERNGRRLSARGKKIPFLGSLYSIVLTVESTDSDKPLVGNVKFHLHPTFINSTPIIFVKDGKAELTLTAWGAFTVGAEADDGATTLELDLSDPKWGFSEEFRSL
ncbi:hypothetical protein GCM10027275_56280 [Rhabdobacter roseus]